MVECEPSIDRKSLKIRMKKKRMELRIEGLQEGIRLKVKHEEGCFLRSLQGSANRILSSSLAGTLGPNDCMIAPNYLYWGYYANYTLTFLPQAYQPGMLLRLTLPPEISIPSPNASRPF
jgi:hypothetical protein